MRLAYVEIVHASASEVWERTRKLGLVASVWTFAQLAIGLGVASSDETFHLHGLGVSASLPVALGLAACINAALWAAVWAHTLRGERMRNYVVYLYEELGLQDAELRRSDASAFASRGNRGIVDTMAWNRLVAGEGSGRFALQIPVVVLGWAATSAAPIAAQIVAAFRIGQATGWPWWSFVFAFAAAAAIGVPSKFFSSLLTATTEHWYDHEVWGRRFGDHHVAAQHAIYPALVMSYVAKLREITQQAWTSAARSGVGELALGAIGALAAVGALRVSVATIAGVKVAFTRTELLVFLSLACLWLRAAFAAATVRAGFTARHAEELLDRVHLGREDMTSRLVSPFEGTTPESAVSLANDETMTIHRGPLSFGWGLEAVYPWMTGLAGIAVVGLAQAAAQVAIWLGISADNEWAPWAWPIGVVAAAWVLLYQADVEAGWPPEKASTLDRLGQDLFTQQWPSRKAQYQPQGDDAAQPSQERDFVSDQGPAEAIKRAGQDSA